MKKKLLALLLTLCLVLGLFPIGVSAIETPNGEYEGVLQLVEYHVTQQALADILKEYEANLDDFEKVYLNYLDGKETTRELIWAPECYWGSFAKKVSPQNIISLTIELDDDVITIDNNHLSAALYTDAATPFYELAYYKPQYTLTYNANGGKVNPETVQVTEGDTVELNVTPTYEGNLFVGWTTDETVKDQIFDRTATDVPATITKIENVTAPLTVYAVWDKDENDNDQPDYKETKYTVTYKDGVNGKVFEDKVHENLLVDEKTPAFNKGSNPTREGYVFSGWEPTPATEVSGNAEYVAQWTEKQILVSFLDSDNSTPVRPQDTIKFTTTEAIVPPAGENVTPVSGKVFKGWGIAASDGTVTSYKGAYTYEALAELVNAKDGWNPDETEGYLTFTPVFEDEPVTEKVTFIYVAGKNGALADGAESTKVYDVNAGETYPFEAPAVVPNPGYQMKNWQLPDGLDFSFTSGDVVLSGAKAGGTYTITALFEENPEDTKDLTYYVDYYVDGSLQEKKDITKKIWAGTDTLEVTENDLDGTYGILHTTDPVLPTNVKNGDLIQAYYYKDSNNDKIADMNQIHVTFVIDEGMGTYDGDTDWWWTCKDTSAETFPLNTPVVTAKEGFEFIGWACNDGATVTEDNGTYYLTQYTLGRAYTLTARFEKTEPAPEMVRPIFVYKDGDTTVGNFQGLVMEKGVHNFSEILETLEENAPEGYKVSISGDFYADQGREVEVAVEHDDPDAGKTLRIFWAIDNPEAAAWDDGTSESYTQTIAWAERNEFQPMPKVTVEDGYKLASWSVSGTEGQTWSADAATFRLGDALIQMDNDGGYVSITANIVSEEPAEVAMKIRFMDGDEFVAGGDYFLPLGVQNYSILTKYVPEGYRMCVAGDFMVTDGGKLDVPVEKIVEDTYTVTLVGEGNRAYGEGTYEAGETVTIYAGTKTGYSFDRWVTRDVTLRNADDSRVSFVMPEHDVTIRATWDRDDDDTSSSGKTYPIYIEETRDGEVESSHKRAAAGTTITLTVEPEDGSELVKLTVVDEDGDKINVRYHSRTDEYTFTMPASEVTVKAVFDSDLPFKDVSVDSWYYDAVSYVYSNGLMNGISATRFAPNAKLNRAMIAQVLYNLEGETRSYPTVFSDVADSAWYADAVNWAADKGIVEGYGNGKFGPEDNITREQMAAILYRYADYKGYDVRAAARLDKFNDADQVSDWAEEAMSWAVAEDLMDGKGNNLLDPTGTATRAEVATILMRFCETIVEA